MSAAPTLSTPEAGGDGALSLILFSGSYDRIHYGLVMAAAATAIGRPVTVFVTMEAVKGFLATTNVAAWRTLPAERAPDGGQADDTGRAIGIGGFEELLAASVEFGARFIVCEMALRALSLTAAHLRSDVPFEVAGMVTLLADHPPGGTMLFL